MRKELVHEKEVAASADAIWAVYKIKGQGLLKVKVRPCDPSLLLGVSPNISTLLKEKLLPGMFEKLDILEGDGASVGTIILLKFRDPGMIPRTFLEKFTKVDHEKRLLEVEVIQGGYLELGCTFYLNRMQIKEKGLNSCVIESTLIFEAPEELMEYASQYAKLDALISMAEVISKYVLEQQFRVFGVVVRKPKLGLSTLVLLCIFIITVVVLGGLWIGGVSI